MKSNTHISQEQLERIEQYLEGRMTPDALAAFEAELQSDPTLQEQVEEVRSLILGIESASLQSELDQFHEELVPVRTLDTNQPPRNDSVKRLNKVIRYVAAAVVVVGFAGFLLLNSSSPSEKLFAKHFTPDPGLPTTMGVEDQYEFYDAMVNYKQGDYESAIEKWRSLAASETKNDTLSYFIGIAYLADGNEEEAISYLKPLSEQSRNSFEKETHYYLGLAYLKSNNSIEAKKYLTFSGTESAREVLDELKD
ncbi:MAG: hypothetical protein AAF466_03510 [Bacteroidota bacterium]